MRALLALLFVSVQLSGLFRIDWRAFALLILGGGLFVGFIRLGVRGRWAILPTANFALDQLLSVFLLSVSGGAASPYVFLVYLHIASAIVFLRRQRAVVAVGVIQVGVLVLSSFFRSWAGGEAHWPFVLIHALGVLVTAWALAEPASILYRDAETDALTGAMNRRAGLRDLAYLTETSQPFSILFADLKRFKEVNDRYGHAVGDEVLKGVAELLLSSVREDDPVIRYGGDEFLVATRSEAHALMERLQGTLSQPLSTSAGTVAVAIDIGVAHFPGDARTLGDLIRFADHHMFTLKQNGG